MRTKKAANSRFGQLERRVRARRSGALSTTVALVLMALLALPSAAAALCCQRPSAACADTVGGILTCVLQRGTLRLDGVCSANLCQPPPPPVTGCCSVGLLKCAAAADTPQACSILRGTFLAGGRCTILGCLPGLGAPTRTATASSTPTATKTKTPPPTSTATRTATASSRPTATATNRPTATATNPPTGTATNPPTVTATNPPTATATNPPTATATEPPTATETAPPTATETAPPTATETGTATSTPTASETSTATSTATASETSTATSTATASETPTPTITLTPTPTETPTPTLRCGEQAVVVDAGLDAEEIVHYQPPNPLSCDQRTATVPPAPAPTPLCCPLQNPSGGGCHLLNTMDGSIDNVFDARGIVDQAACAPNGGTVSVRWEILFPPTLQGAQYASTGITGYFSPVLTIHPSSLPSLEGTDAGSDTFWRARLTVNEYPADGGTEILSRHVLYFRFKYQQSELSLQMWTDCQRIGHIDNDLCKAVAINGLPTTEPHCEGGEGGNCPQFP